MFQGSKIDLAIFSPIAKETVKVFKNHQNVIFNLLIYI